MRSRTLSDPCDFLTKVDLSIALAARPVERAFSLPYAGAR
jgi:hypothetical protein